MTKAARYLRRWTKHYDSRSIGSEVNNWQARNNSHDAVMIELNDSVCGWNEEYSFECCDENASSDWWMDLPTLLRSLLWPKALDKLFNKFRLIYSTSLGRVHTKYHLLTRHLPGVGCMDLNAALVAIIIWWVCAVLKYVPVNELQVSYHKGAQEKLDEPDLSIHSCHYLQAKPYWMLRQCRL